MLIPIKVDYGVRMLVHLAMTPSGVYTSTDSISESQHIPEAYLLRISWALQRVGLMDSRRGRLGGHRLGCPASEITVADVVRALDSSLAPVDCVDDADKCSFSMACSQRDLWSDIEKMLLEYLDNIRISELAAKQKKLVWVNT